MSQSNERNWVLFHETGYRLVCKIHETRYQIKRCSGSYLDKAPFHKEYEESKTGWEACPGGGGGSGFSLRINMVYKN